MTILKGEEQFPHFNYLCLYKNVVILFQENFQTRTHPDEVPRLIVCYWLCCCCVTTQICCGNSRNQDVGCRNTRKQRIHLEEEAVREEGTNQEEEGTSHQLIIGSLLTACLRLVFASCRHFSPFSRHIFLVIWDFIWKPSIVQNYAVIPCKVGSSDAS